MKPISVPCRRLVRARALIGLFACLLMCAAIPSGAVAASGWWHLGLLSRPTVLTPGAAENAVQVLSIDATSGHIELEREEHKQLKVEMPFNVSSVVLQEKLETLYGSGNVQVQEGTEDTASFHTWTVTFAGSLADQPIQNMFIQNKVLSGGKGEAGVSVVSPGRADGEIVVSAVNVGSGSIDGSVSPVDVGALLPAGLRAVGVSGEQPEPGGSGQLPMSCVLATLTCSTTAALTPFQALEVRVDVVVEAGSVEAAHGFVDGGGVLGGSVERAVSLSGIPSFGVEDFEMRPEEEGGMVAGLAGSHPFQLTTTLSLSEAADVRPLAVPARVEPVAMAKDINAKLPRGLVGNPQALPVCTMQDFLTLEAVRRGIGDSCPADSAVGVASVTVNEPSALRAVISFTVPIFNLEPDFGEPARFGFYIPIAKAPVLLDASLRSGAGEDYGITVSSLNTPQNVGFLSSTLTFWGVPGDPVHDPLRGWGCLQETEGMVEGFPCSLQKSVVAPAFQTLPTTCGSGMPRVNINSWNEPGVSGEFDATEPFPEMVGCSRLRLEPTIGTLPTTESASSPTGLRFDLDISDEGITASGGVAESQVKKAVVALPEGVTANPSLAVGLSACGEAQYDSEELDTPAGTGCPEQSKIGTVEVFSPLLRQKLEGSVFIAKQDENPFGSLLALYVIVRNPETGVFIKLAGQIAPDPVTGQLVSVFDGLPQLPFSHFRLSFRQGQRSPLITPPVCGTYTTTATVYPWSDPQTPVVRTATFTIASGVAGTPCPTGGVPSFEPSVVAGTLNNAAGAYSPFSLRDHQGRRRTGDHGVLLTAAPRPDREPGRRAVLSRDGHRSRQGEHRRARGSSAVVSRRV